MKFMNKKMLLLISIFFMVVIFISVKSGKALSVMVAHVEDNLAIEIFGIGTAEAKVVSNIAFQVEGKLSHLMVDQADLVKAGDLLARLDDSEQVAIVNKSALEVSQAKAFLAQTILAEGKAKTTFKYKQMVAKRHENLIAEQSISQGVSDASKNEEQTAKVEWKIAKSNITLAQSALNSATAQLSLQKIILEKHQLKAPYDAVVLVRQKELGSVLKSGEPLFTLVDPSTTWVRAYIDESRVGNIKVGQTASIRYRSKAQQVFKGSVARINMESSRVNEEFSVYIRCLNCPKETSNLHLGEQAEVTIITQVMSNVVAIPENFVKSFDSQKMTGDIWLIKNEKLALKSVNFLAKTLDARLVVDNKSLQDNNDKTQVITHSVSSLSVGKSATVLNQGQL